MLFKTITPKKRSQEEIVAAVKGISRFLTGKSPDKNVSKVKGVENQWYLDEKQYWTISFSKRNPRLMRISYKFNSISNDKEEKFAKWLTTALYDIKLVEKPLIK